MSRNETALDRRPPATAASRLVGGSAFGTTRYPLAKRNICAKFVQSGYKASGCGHKFALSAASCHARDAAPTTATNRSIVRSAEGTEMATDYQFRLYAILKNTPDLFARYSTAVAQQDLQLLTEYTHMLLDGKPHVSQELLKEIRVVSAPSLDWQPTIVGATPPPDIPPDELVIAYGFDRAYIAEQFINFVITNRDAPLDVHANAFLDVGTDPGGSTADHWCPGPANRAIFRHRASARQTVNADALSQHLPKPLTGQAVNVVIIDQGLDQAAIPKQNW